MIPKLVDFPIYVNKTELTTVTLFYDAFYDFGILGVGIFAGTIGGISFYFEKMLRNTRSNVSYIIYAQYFIYLSLAFFTTWFSNPATWFYFIITVLVYLITKRRKKRRYYVGE